MALYKNPKYDLKRKYNRALEIGIIFSLTVIIIAFKYFPKFEREKIDLPAPQELISVEDVVKTKHDIAPPPPPKPAIPIAAPVEEVLEDIEIAETELDVNENIAPPPPPPPVEKKEEENEEPVFFVAVEEMPEPIGGIEAIQAKIAYPQIAQRAGVQGRVFINAFVDENGVVNKVELLKGIGGGCDEAAIEAVMATKFKPGKQRGKPVKVQVTVPVLFKLVST